MITKNAIIEKYPNGQIEWNVPIEWCAVGVYRFHGEAQQFYPDGKRKLCRTYEHGVEVGSEYIYYPDGSPMSVLPFGKGGKKHGEYAFFPKEGGAEYVQYEGGEIVSGSRKKVDEKGTQ